MKILAVADSDSYLKWAACLLDTLGDGWEPGLAVIRTPIVPSSGQVAAAIEGTRFAEAPVRTVRGLRATLAETRPDAVVVACTGPTVDALARDVLRPARAGGDGPVLVTGLPGISVPATEKAWLYRGECDLFVVHSEREVAEFTALGAELRAGGRVGLARLPYLRAGTGPAAEPDRVIFATQAKVPRRRDEREAILFALAELAERRPGLDVVVKLRARDDERQTHNERHHYERLWRDLAAAGLVAGRGTGDGAVRFAAGAMHEHLARASGFVTVSSTAALEAIAQSVPLLVLSDFGVGAEMINLVFEDSGCLGSLDELAKGVFRAPRREWCAANYFHAEAESDWEWRLAGLVDEARAGRLAPPRPLIDGPEWAADRRRARRRLIVPPPLLRAGYRAKRRLRRLSVVIAPGSPGRPGRRSAGQRW